MKYRKGSFITLPNKEHLKGKPSEMQTIYLWICDHSDEDGECFPSRARLAREAGCGIRTVDKYLKQLVEDGFLSSTQRKKAGTSENMSNLYQIMLLDALPSVKKDTTPSVEKDAVTKPSINQTHLTTIEVIKEEKLTLPLVRADGVSTGKTPTDRLLYLYSKLYFYTYTSYYKPNWGRDKKILTGMLSDFSEIQIAYMLCVYFNWHGMTGDSTKDYDFYTSATFPIPMFKTTCNKYEVYIRNVLGFKFDDDKEMLNKVGEHLRSIS